MTASRRSVAAIFLLALILRLGWIGAVHNEQFGDATWYHARAISLINGQGYSIGGIPTAYFPPGYPLFLVALDPIVGLSIPAAKFANALLGAFTAAFGFLLAVRLLGVRGGRIAGLLLAIHPNAIVSSSLLMSETLLAFLLTVVWCLLCSPSGQRLSTRTMFLTGLLVGAGALVKPASMVVVPALAIYAWLIARAPFARVVRGVAVLLVGCGLVIGPWTVRNRLVMHAPVLISTNGGINFWMSQVAGGYREPPPELAMGWGQTLSPKDEVRTEHLAYRAGLDFLRHAPLSPLRLVPVKTVKFMYADIDGLLANSGYPAVSGPRDIPRAASGLALSVPVPLKIGFYAAAELFYLALLLLALIGVIRAMRTQPIPAALLLLVFVLWVAFHTVLFFPAGRYRLPVMPIVIVFAAGGLAGFIRREDGGAAPGVPRA